MSYWRANSHLQCQTYSYGYGFASHYDGEISLDEFGISNSGYYTHRVECPEDFMDSYNTATPSVRLSFSRYNTSNQVPRFQFCSSWYGCSGFYYASSSATGTVTIDALAGIWRHGARNTLEVPLDPTNGASGTRFMGYSVGNEYPNNGYFNEPLSIGCHGLWSLRGGAGVPRRQRLGRTQGRAAARRRGEARRGGDRAAFVDLP
jgi:hypothetical protein